MLGAVGRVLAMNEELREPVACVEAVYGIVKRLCTRFPVEVLMQFVGRSDDLLGEQKRRTSPIVPDFHRSVSIDKVDVDKVFRARGGRTSCGRCRGPREQVEDQTGGRDGDGDWPLVWTATIERRTVTRGLPSWERVRDHVDYLLPPPSPCPLLGGAQCGLARK